MRTVLLCFYHFRLWLMAALALGAAGVLTVRWAMRERLERPGEVKAAVVLGEGAGGEALLVTDKYYAEDQDVYRLTVIELPSGRRRARVLLERAAACQGAGEGRLWCHDGHYQLVQRSLSTLRVIADGAAIVARNPSLRAGLLRERPTVDADGTLVVETNDGYRFAIDPATLAATAQPTARGEPLDQQHRATESSATLGDSRYGFSSERRQHLLREQTALHPEQTYLEPSFLCDTGSGQPLRPPDTDAGPAALVQHVDTLDGEAQHLLWTLVDLSPARAGQPRWTHHSGLHELVAVHRAGPLLVAVGRTGNHDPGGRTSRLQLLDLGTGAERLNQPL